MTRATTVPDLIRGWRAIAAYCRTGKDTAQRMAFLGKLPTFRLGNDKFIYARRSELDKFLATRTPSRVGRPPIVHSESEIAAIKARRADRIAELREIEQLRRVRALEDVGAAGLLTGGAAIARYLDWPEKKVFYQNEKGLLPTFKQGRTLCALRSALDEHFAEQTRLAMQNRKGR